MRSPPRITNDFPAGASGAHATAARAHGFTLVELVVALAVAGVLLSMAAPSFRDLAANARLSGEYNRLAGDLRLARLEAIKRGGSVSVCARDGDDACGDDWGAGWHVFTEKSAADGGVDGRLDDGERILSSRAGDADNRLAITARALSRPAALGARDHVLFDSRGRADWTLGTLVLCDERGAVEAMALILNGAGALRSARRPTSGTGAALDAFGDAVVCPS